MSRSLFRAHANRYRASARVLRDQRLTALRAGGRVAWRTRRRDRGIAVQRDPHLVRALRLPGLGDTRLIPYVGDDAGFLIGPAAGSGRDDDRRARRLDGVLGIV